MSEEFDLETALIHRFGAFTRQLDRAVEAELRPLGLTRLKWNVLLAIGQQGVTQPSALAACVGVDKAIISRLVAAMCKDGLLEVAGRDGDKRQKDLTATSSGKAALREACVRIEAVTEARFTALRPRQRIRLLQFLNAVDPQTSVEPVVEPT